MNQEITNFLNAFTQNKFFAEFVFLFADLPIFIIPLFFIIFWLLFNYKKQNDLKNNLLYIFYICLITAIVSLIIQHIYFVERPMMSITNSGNLILKQIPNASFPSDHSGISFSFLMGLFLFGFRKYFYIFLPFFLLMDFSRIAGGVHWFSDILGGIVIGFFSGILVFKFRNCKIFTQTNKILLKIANFLKL